MISLGRIGRHTTYLLAGRLITQALGLLLTVVIAARLGAAGLGMYALAGAVVYIANVATTFGTDMVLTRDIASGQGADAWLPALIVQLALTGAVLTAIWIGSALVGDDEIGPVTRILSLSLVPAALASVSAAALRGAGRMGILAIVSVLTTALQVTMVWLALEMDGRLVSAVLAMAGAQSIGAIAAWAAAARTHSSIRRPARPRRAELVAMARRAAPIGLLGWIGVVYQRLAVVIVWLLAGPVATGWFSSSSKLVEGSKTGHVALFGALYPAMATVHAGSDRGEPEPDILRTSLGLTMALAVLIAGVLVVIGPFAVRLLFGPGFGPASGAVAILGLSVIPSTLATYESLELIAARREAATLRALVLSLAVLGVLAIGLITVMGWLGACWAIVGAETAQAAALALARRDLRRPRVRAGAARLADRPYADGVP